MEKIKNSFNSDFGGIGQALTFSLFPISLAGKLLSSPQKISPSRDHINICHPASHPRVSIFHKYHEDFFLVAVMPKVTWGEIFCGDTAILIAG
jgi:hypothetical protein